MSGTSPPTPDPDLESEAFYEHQEMRLKVRDERYLRRRERETCRKTIGLGRQTATHGPAAHFRIDLCHDAVAESETTWANGKNSGLEDTEKRNIHIEIDPMQH